MNTMLKKRLTERRENGDADCNCSECKHNVAVGDEWVCDDEFGCRDRVLEKLCTLEDMIEDGRIVVLPCKVGTEVFLSDYPEGHHRLKEYKFCGNKIVMVIENWEFQRTCKRFLCEFGVTVFLTREEAALPWRSREINV